MSNIRLFALAVLLLLPGWAFANQTASGFCTTGGIKVTTFGSPSSNPVQGSYPGCIITVNIHGGALAVITDANGGALANPFTASPTTGFWEFAAANGFYDITLSGGTPAMPSPMTIVNLLLNDPGTAAITASSFTGSGFISSTALVATSGIFRCASVDNCLNFRNNGNTLDLVFKKTGAAAGNLPADVLDASAFGGIKVSQFFSNSAQSAATGVLACSASDTCVSFRNQANSADIPALTKDASDRIIIGGAAGFTASIGNITNGLTVGAGLTVGGASVLQGITATTITASGEIAPSITGGALGDTAHRFDAFIRNLDVSGTTTGIIGGGGTANTITKFTSPTAVGNSGITDNGTTVSTSEAVSLGTTLGVTGLTSLKNLEGIRFAADFAGSSTTCGIAEAYAALPSSGGEIILQQGNCSAAGWPVTIQKPILLVGQGMGGTTDAGTNAVVAAGSWLTNTSTGNSFFIVTLPAVGNSTEGVTFRDFAMFGNKAMGGATAGDCVDINGGSGATQVRALNFQNIHCNQPKGSGFVIKDNAFMLNFLNVHVNQSGSHCYVIKDGVNAGVNSQIHFLQSTGDLCGGSNASFNPGTADGLNISGSTSREVDIDQSTFADSNNGINVVAGAVNVNLLVSHSDFETNTICDISLNDGFDHNITANTIRGTGTGARGICTNFPAGAVTQAVQLIMSGNNFSGHTVQDVTIGATTKNCFIGPEGTNIYTYSDASNNCARMDSNNGGSITITGTSGLLPATNGTVPLGSAGLVWSAMFTFDANATTYRPRATGKILISDTTPTISAGFGTGASVVGSNGTAAFAINVGTGGTANSGTIGLPTSSGGWVCTCEDQTTTSATVNRCKQTNGTVSTAIIGNFNTTPAAAAWVASDILQVSCFAR